MAFNNNSQGNQFQQNKGYTIHYNEEYVGHLVISDKLDQETIDLLVDPKRMQKVLQLAELRKFKPKTPVDAKGIKAIFDETEDAPETGETAEATAE